MIDFYHSSFAALLLYTHVLRDLLDPSHPSRTKILVLVYHSWSDISRRENQSDEMGQTGEVRKDVCGRRGVAAVWGKHVFLHLIANRQMAAFDSLSSKRNK